MNSQVDSKRTLYGDWKARRDRQADLQCDEYDRVHLQLLDYLLDRYKDSPLVARPAGASPIQPTVVNERAIIVHHHIGNLGAGVQNASEAKNRVATVLQRMQTATTDDESEGTFDRNTHEVSGKLWERIVRRIRYGDQPDALMERALRESPFLPSTALIHLHRRIASADATDMKAAELLTRAQNRSVCDLVARSWRSRVVAQRRDNLTHLFEEYFENPQARATKQQRMRLELADERPEVRAAALRILSRVGSLEDIGLLSDLLTLPVQPDEYEMERRDLLETARSISDRVPSAP